MAVYIPRKKSKHEFTFNSTSRYNNAQLYQLKSYLCLNRDLRHLCYEDYIIDEQEETTLTYKEQGGLIINGKIYVSMYSALMDMRGPYLLNNYKEFDRKNLLQIIKCRIEQDVDYCRILGMFHKTSFQKVYFLYLEYNMQNVSISRKGKNKNKYKLININIIDTI